MLGGLSAGGVAPVIKEGAASIQTVLGNSSTSPLLSFLDGRPSSLTDRPKAYLNYVFFDENFNVIQNAGAADLVKANDNDDLVALTNIKAPQNGYVYIYLSNESDWPVYFDDFNVAHERGAIIEESHYYPYGLKIAGISSRAFNKLPNRYGFQGDFSEVEEETGWDGFELRDYDSQIARWIQQDPYDQYANGYLGMGNNPVNNIDPDGGWGIDFGTVGDITGSILGDRLLAAGAGALAGWGIDKLTGGEGGWGAGIGAMAGFGATFIPPFDFSKIGTFFSKGLNSISQVATFITNGNSSNPLKVLITRVIISGQVVYDPVKLDDGRIVETGRQFLDGDVMQGVITTEVTYDGYTVYGGFNSTTIGPYSHQIKFGVAIPEKIFGLRPLPFQWSVQPLGGVPIARMPIPDLHATFTGGTNQLDPSGMNNSMTEIRWLARYLTRRPGLNILLTGNAGWTNRNNDPIRLLGPAGNNLVPFNGGQATSRQLVTARAMTIRNVLVNRFSINPSRIRVAPGNVWNDPSGRFVGVQQIR